jgi:hypothetical protein
MSKKQGRFEVLARLPTADPDKFVYVELQYRDGGDDQVTGEWSARGYYLVAFAFYEPGGRSVCPTGPGPCSMLLKPAKRFSSEAMRDVVDDLKDDPVKYKMLAVIAARRAGQRITHFPLNLGAPHV